MLKHLWLKASSKIKNEIKGSTAKIWAQKGTGNARHASRKAPIFVGGGVAHGPKGQSNYAERKLNKSEKKISIASLISDKNIKDLANLNTLIIDCLRFKAHYSHLNFDEVIKISSSRF